MSGRDALETALRRAFWKPENHGRWSLIAADLLSSDWLRDRDAALTAKAKADAWDEGAIAATADYGIGEAVNPYREAQS